jgi:septal ring factor EnvC (AmiA/AmiB activator)
MSNVSQVKDWVSFAIVIVAAISGIIFWVQGADDKRINRIEGEVAELKQDIKEITKQNSEILRLIGRIEGAMKR